VGLQAGWSSQGAAAAAGVSLPVNKKLGKSAGARGLHGGGYRGHVGHKPCQALKATAAENSAAAANVKRGWFERNYQPVVRKYA
jgi:hypothetical protein